MDDADLMRVPRMYTECADCVEYRPDESLHPVRRVAWSAARLKWLCDECWDKTGGEWKHAVKADFFAETDQHD